MMSSTSGTDSSSSVRSVVTATTTATSVSAGMANSSGPPSRSTSTLGMASSKGYPSQLLLAPGFLTCAGAVLFRGLPPLRPTSSSSSGLGDLGTASSSLSLVVEEKTAPWHPPSPPSLSSSSPSSSPPAPKSRELELLDLAADRLKRRADHPRPSSLSTPTLQVCLIYHSRKNEFLLAKGRKDQFENDLLATALRETHEETGYQCKPLPLSIITRAPAPGADIKDSPAGLQVSECTEAFALTIRNISPTNVKLIYWYIAEATSETEEEGTRMPSESAFSSHWYDLDEAVETLTYEHDRNVVRQAVELVRAEARRREALNAVAGCSEAIGMEKTGAAPVVAVAGPPTATTA